MLIGRFKDAADRVATLDLFERYEVLEELGMFPHESIVGHPERSFEQWSKEELDLAHNIFKTWPSFKDAEELYEDIAGNVALTLYLQTQGSGFANRKETIQATADELTKVCRDVLGDDFPAIELRFVKNSRPGYFGGLAPDGKIDVNELNLDKERVNGSEFEGDLSYMELIFHEGIHLVQRHLAETSDGQTEDMRLSSRVAEAFYESTFAAKPFMRELYWDHPYEREARKVASTMMTKLKASMNNELVPTDRLEQ